MEALDRIMKQDEIAEKYDEEFAANGWKNLRIKGTD